MENQKTIIIISEAGWQGARQLSIELSKKGIMAIVLIKGRLGRHERDMITKYKGIKNIFISQKLFAVLIFAYILFLAICFKPMVIFVTKEKTEKTILKLEKFFKNIHLARLRESENYFSVFDLNMRLVDYRSYL